MLSLECVPGSIIAFFSISFPYFFFGFIPWEFVCFCEILNKNLNETEEERWEVGVFVKSEAYDSA